jgi:predicted enzyme related to lactoylglutathione lyase
MTQKPVPFVWYDLMTNDVAAASKFYADVVGWKIEDSGMPGMAYSILKAGDTMVGGLMATPPGAPMPPMWGAYIYSADVDADVKRVEKAGGSLCKPAEDIPSVGRFAAVADPSGSMFYLFKPMGPEGGGSPAGNAPGTIGWRELRAGDGKAAWNFYSDLFGWQKSTAMDMGPMGVYQIFKTTGADDVGAMMTRAPDMSPGWFFYFNVPALDAAMAAVKAGGGKLTGEAMEVPTKQWVVHAADPQGAAFGLVAPKR